MKMNNIFTKIFTLCAVFALSLNVADVQAAHGPENVAGVQAAQRPTLRELQGPELREIMRKKLEEAQFGNSVEKLRQDDRVILLAAIDRLLDWAEKVDLDDNRNIKILEKRSDGIIKVLDYAGGKTLVRPFSELMDVVQFFKNQTVRYRTLVGVLLVSLKFFTAEDDRLLRDKSASLHRNYYDILQEEYDNKLLFTSLSVEARRHEAKKREAKGLEEKRQ